MWRWKHAGSGPTEWVEVVDVRTYPSSAAAVRVLLDGPPRRHATFDWDRGFGCFTDRYRLDPSALPLERWLPPVELPEGAQLARLGDVPVGWLYRYGYEEPDQWRRRQDDDRSYEGALVECKPR